MSPSQPARKSAKRAAKKTPTKPRKPARIAGPGPAALYERLHAVLHSVRTIAHFEDSLCVLLEHVKTARELEPKVAHELFDLLEKLPAELYLQDLEALRAALPEVSRKLPAKSAKRVPPKRAR